ncbi:MAG: MopE-related protein [Bacteroidota bacterium]
MKRNFTLFFLALFFDFNCLAQVLDPSFGNGGKFVLSGIQGGASVVQPDGKIIFIVQNSLYRLNSDGAYDNSFGTTGKVTLNFEAGFLGLQPDGKIIAVGGTGNQISVVRLNVNGSADAGFNSSGINSLSIATLSFLLIQTDGKIIIAGTGTASGLTITLIRLNADGSPDTGFGNSGLATHPTISAFGPNDSSPIISVVQQSDGKIVVIGLANPGNSLGCYAMRFNSNGTLDNAYGGNGTGYRFVSITSYPSSAMIGSDDKIIVTGTSTNYDIIRLNEDGSADNSFNGTGILSIPTDVDALAVLRCAFQPDGKILMTTLVNSQNNDIGLYRINTNGTLDNSFNGMGSITIDFNNTTDFATLISPLADGKILIYGATVVNGVSTLAMARILTLQHTYYKDVDGDGYGDNASTTTGYYPPQGYVVNNTDCDDNNPSVHPGAVEICGNNIDDNCDGQVDEGCSTLPAASINDVTTSESQGTAVLTVTIAQPSARTMTVDKKGGKPKTININYKTVDGTAVSKGKGRNPAIDYIPQKGTLTFRNGATSAKIRISIIKDRIAEGSEYFDVVLSVPKHEDVVLAKGTARVTISDGAAARSMSDGANPVAEDRQLTLSPLDKTFKVKTYPNPSDNSFHLQVTSTAKEEVQIRIMDIQGRMVKKIVTSPNTSITFGSELKNGIYFAEVRQGDNYTIQKLVKL